MVRGAEERLVLIDSLYDAAFDDDAFANLAPTVGRLMGVDQAMVSTRHGLEILGMSMTGTPDQSEDYLNHYCRIDPWTPAILRLAPGRFAYGDELAPEAEVRDSEFYVDYARPMGVRDPMCGRLVLAGGVDLMVAIGRSEDNAPYDEAMRAELGDVAGHVRRVVQMRRRIEAQAGGLSLRQAALDAVGFGLAMVEEDGRLLVANQAMERLAAAGQGVRLAGGRLTSVAPADAEPLARLVLEAARLRRGGACVLTGPQGLPCASVIAAPASPREPFDGLAVQGRATVAVAPLADRGVLARSLTGRLFGLSPAEAEIVAALWGGAAAREIALQRRVKPTTLKTQLEAIYLKTGVANQRELLRLLGGLPQVRPGG